MDEEEELKAALAAVVLNWPEGSGWVGAYHRSGSGHLTRVGAGMSVCRSWAFVAPTPCPKCALIWYREVRGE